MCACCECVMSKRKTFSDSRFPRYNLRFLQPFSPTFNNSDLKAMSFDGQSDSYDSDDFYHRIFPKKKMSFRFKSSINISINFKCLTVLAI
jgi:hypothetical protein